MSMSFNKITIVGYLGRDPELRYTPQGTAVCNMSVATTERRKNPAGQNEEHTTWFRITVWGRQGEVANEYLAKGRLVYIEGRLRLEEYTDREGNQRISLEVTATDIQFLGQRNGSDQSVSANAGREENVEGGEDNTRRGRDNTQRGKTGSRSTGSKQRTKAAIPPDSTVEDIPF
jgi:single-strand DNA-binding protein